MREERLRLALDAARMATWDWDIASGDVIWNDEHYRILGYEPGTVKPSYQAWAERVHPEDLASAEAQLRQSMEKGGDYIAEFRVALPNGAVCWIEARGRYDRDAGGRAVRSYGVLMDITERKRAEEKLRESEERFRVAQEMSLDAFTILTAVRDASGVIVDFRWEYVNPEAGRILRHPPEDLIGQRLLDVLPGNKTNSDLFKRYVRVVETGEPHDYELPYESEGIRGWFRNMAVKLGDGIAIYFNDITERKRAEEALRQLNEQLEQRVAERTIELVKAGERGQAERQRFLDVLETLPVVITLLRPDHRVEWVNQAYREALGDNVGQLCYASQFGREKPCEECQAFIPLQTGQPQNWQWTLPNGRTFDIYNFPFADADGSPMILEMDIDITERKAAEAELARHREHLEEVVQARTEELRQSRERLDWVLSTTGVGHWLNTLPLGGLNWDERTRELFFVPTGVEPTIELFWERLHPEDREPTRLAVEAALRDRTLYAIDHRAIDPATGDIRWIHSSGQATYAADGTPIRFDGIDYDITERKQTEEALREANEQLRQADRRKDEFLATLAHELRNPLAPVRYAVQILRLAGLNEEARQRQQNIIDRQMTHMARLLDDLLDVSRVTRGKIELRSQPLCLADVLAHVADTARPTCEARHQQLHFTPPPADLRVEGDIDRLEQVVGNLLVNASKFTGDGGQIWLEAAREADQAIIRVRDNGSGIAPKILPRIFDLFVQANDPRHRSQGGLGIGLTLVRRLVEMHDGTVEARSEGEGQGSEFIIRLPALPEETIEEPAPQVILPNTAANRIRRILVVDDIPDSAASLAELLTLWGHEAQAVHDGVAAIEMVRQWRPEIVLLDIGMPGIDGYETARRLRAEHGRNGLTLVALTGFGQETDREAAREAGFDAHLVKPVDITALRDLLARLSD